MLAADGFLDGATVWPTHHDHSQALWAGKAHKRKKATARAAMMVAANLGIPGDTPINAQLSPLNLRLRLNFAPIRNLGHRFPKALPLRYPLKFLVLVSYE